MQVGIISPVITKQAYMPCYLVVQEITELQEDVTKQTGDSKQSFYNNIDTDNIEIRQIYYIVIRYTRI